MENWKNEILNSLEGLERANPPSDSLQKIQQKIQEQNEAFQRQWMDVAAAVVIRACINIFIVLRFNRSDVLTESTEPYTELVSDYSLY
mgnify:CR=1 FL=1